jgi:hypothetical protein
MGTQTGRGTCYGGATRVLVGVWLWSEEAWRLCRQRWPAGWVRVLEQVGWCELRRNEQINLRLGQGQGEGRGERRTADRSRGGQVAGKVRDALARSCRCPSAAGWECAQSELGGTAAEGTCSRRAGPPRWWDLGVAVRAGGFAMPTVSKFLPISGRSGLVDPH